ncbi:MAG: T9SS type A sorting domain-containing protein [Ignavibacteriaceae bacterium]|nr:T9SS type A sorting domain-containing protein [Ignavibacteriaceae bacterium]
MNKMNLRFSLSFVLFIFIVMAQFAGASNGSGGNSPMANLSGTYYIGAAGTGPGGTNPEFATFRDALDTINNATITGNCIFYITSDITETYADSRGLGLAINPGQFTITFKPYTGVQPVITLNYPTDLNSGPSGAFVIGLPGKGNVAWDSLRTTRNIIFDGSNTVNGTTRDLTIQSAPTSHRNAMPLVIVGDVSDVIIKNMNIYYKTQTISTSGNLFIGSVMVRHRNYLGQDWVPRNITFENNHLNANWPGNAQNAQGYGTYQTGTPVPVDFPYNITLKNNKIEGKRRAIGLNLAGSHNIFGNELILNQDIAANTTNEALYAINLDTNSVLNIYNNKFSKVSSMTNAAASGIAAINLESQGTYNVYNNFIYGFALTATNPLAYVRGIRHTAPTGILNFYFNSIYMTDILAGGTVAYNGIIVTDGVNDIKNNIIVNAVVDFAAYCINRTGTLGTFTSNYNNFYTVDATNGNVGFYNDAATLTLAAWQTASGGDANSLNVNPGFVSATDLHLAANSSPVVGKGFNIPAITIDIDNEMRDNVPEMGADEFPGYIPVELVSFSANVSGSTVVLNWQTATEKNNAYFEIEKRTAKGSYEVIGRVNGSGTTLAPVSYTFTDVNPGSAAVSYRLKQVDFDGSVIYSKEVSVDTELPTAFELSQNYPNPFNPSTSIRYSLPAESKVTLEVYSSVGELIATLVNDVQPAGKHIVSFNGSDFSSGTYFYRLTANNTVITKKMQLIK